MLKTAIYIFSAPFTFSQDMNTVDAQIRFTIMAMLRGISGLLTTLIAICYTTPFFLAMILPLSIGYYFLQVSINSTARQGRKLLKHRAGATGGGVK